MLIFEENGHSETSLFVFLNESVRISYSANTLGKIIPRGRNPEGIDLVSELVTGCHHIAMIELPLKKKDQIQTHGVYRSVS